MTNVTISMDAATLRWVRVEAAKAGQSVSRWVGERLQALNSERIEKAAAGARIERLVETFEGLPLSENGRINLDRDELYDGGRFRRFDDPALSVGQSGAAEEGGRHGVADDPSTAGSVDP
jgi:hypothetical protein